MKLKKKRAVKKNIFQRFLQLNLWNKIGIVGTIIGIFGTIFSFYTYYSNPIVDFSADMGVIKPSNEPNHLNNINCTPPPNSLILILGSNYYYWTEKHSYYVISYYGIEYVKIKNTSDGYYVDATINRENGRLVAKIVDNQFTINPNQYYKLKSRDEHELRVEGKNKELLLYLRFPNEETILFEGTLWSEKDSITIDSDGIWVASNDIGVKRSCIENNMVGTTIPSITGVGLEYLEVYGED